MLTNRIAIVAGILCLGAVANAQQISEIVSDVPGIDTGKEFIELRGPANFNWSGYKLAILEGFNTGRGLVDAMINLNGAVSGSNGILLVQKTGSIFTPAPSPDSGIFNWTSSNASSTNDIENDSVTVVLGVGNWPTGTLDFDPTNTGTFVSTVFGSFAPVDAVSWTDSGANHNGYADQISPSFPNFAYTTFTPKSVYRVQNALQTSFLGWVAMDVTGTGPYIPVAARFTSLVVGFTAANLPNSDPGNVNVGFTPATGSTLAIDVNPSGYIGDFVGLTANVEVIDIALVSHVFTAQTISTSGIVNITLPPAFTVGAATVRVKSSITVTKQDLVTINTGANSFTSNQLGGDADNDDFIGLDDFNALSNSFNLSEGDTGYNGAADFDGDKFVGLDDFNILSNNFNTSGD